MEANKQLVHDFWNKAACGETLYLSDGDYTDQARRRYELEPYIADVANFDGSRDKRVLEIGVGLGADHERFARAGAILSGIDLTARAIEHTKARFAALGFRSDLLVADAENLPFHDNSFDVVYSYGVLHHTPDTERALSEAWRVLKQGGEARVMIYHRYSLVGFMLWIRYSLFMMRVDSLTRIYASYLESPGTKAYSVSAVRKMCWQFSKVNIRTVLTHGDLLSSDAGQRHRGLLLSVAKLLWPRRVLKTLCKGCGLHMLIVARK